MGPIEPRTRDLPSLRAGGSRFSSPYLALAALLVSLASGCAGPGSRVIGPETAPVQLGPRPFYLIDRLDPGPLREKLEACRGRRARPSRFSIGHRGAPLQFPEHTRESYLAAIRMGAGLVECDVTFTRDRELVCRHAQCDLASTTNILETPLAARCREGFSPAVFDDTSGELLEPARARCCTSELSLAEFAQLEGRMDAVDRRALDLEAFLDATPSWRTDLYANGATLMSHQESLELFLEHGVGMTPELKEIEAAPERDARLREPIETGEVFSDQAAFARKLVDAYRDAGVPPEEVALQSFDPEVIRLWLEHAPDYGARAVWLIDPSHPIPTPKELAARHAEGFRILAPPISALLTLDRDHRIVASDFARQIRAAGFGIIAWTAERSGRLRAGRVEGRGRDYYLGPIQAALSQDGDVYRVLDALVQQVGIQAIFSDWPATTTYFANCFGLD